MRIFTEIEELLGKKTFRDPRLEKLKERFNPAKSSFISVEFTNEHKDTCQAIVAKETKKLDFIVEDIERAESLLGKGTNRALMEKVLEILNREQFISEHLTDEELAPLKEYSFLTTKPFITWGGGELFLLLKEVFEKAGLISFFTVNKNEARQWLIPRGIPVIDAAGKIHTDLARGFIRAEVYNIRELEELKNVEEGKQRGIVKVVDRDYIVQEGDVINIKFNVHR